MRTDHAAALHRDVGVNHSRFVHYSYFNDFSSLSHVHFVTKTEQALGLPCNLYPGGRMDFESEGLVLMTNDRELTNRLTHPKFGHTKEYRAFVAHRPEGAQMEARKSGVILEDGYKTSPGEV